MFPMPDGAAYRIQRRKQTRHKSRSVIAQIEVLDTARNEPDIVQQSQYRFLRIIDDMPWDIEAVPFCPESLELPALDIRNLKNDCPVCLEDAENFGQDMSGIRHLFHYVKQCHDIEGPARKSRFTKRTYDNAHFLLHFS